MADWWTLPDAGRRYQRVSHGGAQLPIVPPGGVGIYASFSYDTFNFEAAPIFRVKKGARIDASILTLFHPSLQTLIHQND